LIISRVQGGIRLERQLIVLTVDVDDDYVCIGETLDEGAKHFDRGSLAFPIVFCDYL